MATLKAGTTQGTRFLVLGEQRDPMTGCPGTSNPPKNTIPSTSAPPNQRMVYLANPRTEMS